MDNLIKCKEALETFAPTGFSFVRSTDYIENPKSSGYRSIHYIYKYSSNIQDYDGLKIELQIRTRLQHSWAMAVETASYRTFSPEEETATNLFSSLEQSIDSYEAVLLVSIAKMREIRDAYPSYFLDTREFLQSLKEFNDSCSVYK